MKKWFILLIVLVLFITTIVPSSILAAKDRAAGNKEVVPLVIVKVDSLEEMKVLVDSGLDVVDMDSVNKEVTIVLGSYENEYLQAEGYEYDILVDDLNTPVQSDLQKNEIFSIQSATERTDYRTLADFFNEIEEIEKKYPNLVNVEVIGHSVKGDPIHAIEISTTPGINDGKPESVHMASVHAREWPSGELAMDLAWYLVDNYGKDEQVSHIVDNIRTWIIPMVNPDGFHYSRSGEYRMWRKNLSQNGDGTLGVDLNRNNSYKWGGSGSSGDPNSFTYRGPAPASEPETEAIRDFFLSRNIMTTITGHTYSELILYPWGHAGTALRSADAFIAGMANDMAQWNGYADIRAIDLYPTHGDTVDWVYGITRGIAFTYEYGKEFIPPYEGYRSTEINWGENGSFNFNTFTFSVGFEGTKGQIVHAGKGLTSEDFPAEVEGNIALIERGDGTFREKAENAEAAGAVGVIIYNNASGTVSGTLGSEGVGIPVIGITRADGLEILSQLNNGATEEAVIKYGDDVRESYKQLWEMNLPPFLYNIEKAEEYASKIVGTVIDQTTGNPVEASLQMDVDYTVPLVGIRNGDALTESHSATIDVNGDFEWNVVPSEQPELDTPPYTVTVTAEGYHTQTFEVEIKNFQEIKTLNIELQPVAKALGANKLTWNTNATIPFKFATFNAEGVPEAKSHVKVSVLDGTNIVKTYAEGKGANAVRQTEESGEYMVNINTRALELGAGNYTILIEFEDGNNAHKFSVPVELKSAAQKKAS
ncbi:M14 family zinc carboxypeptidase [Alkalihalobacterium elongatum]|uniref:M14 family zinc carboxypeptidase n=1 Tax=Alkalihalobacterium elongatum TaxID=2675466 RepID=UPI001F1A9FD5|nr:M14 family zinc carboxypeptidase [Alkalihalobacterium elongatum]